MKTFFFFSASALILLLCPHVAVAGVVLSEIMFHPNGNESTDEFIELYNDDMFPADLTAWKISVGGDTDRIVAHHDGLMAAPYQFIIILDSNYFMQSTTYDDLIPENALIVTIADAAFGHSGLSNAHPDTISLISPSGHVVSRYTYTIDNAAGYSDEKIILRSENSANNWANSLTLHGTPGAQNSVTPPDHDLAVTRLVIVPRSPAVGDSIFIYIDVKNLGLNVASDTLILMTQSAMGEDFIQILRKWPIQNLTLGDSVIQEIHSMREARWGSMLVAQLVTADDQPSNNRREFRFSYADSVPQILINEIMYQPAANRSEWIEIFNHGTDDIDLSQWSISDGTGLSDTTKRFHFPAVYLPSEQFMILAHDSDIFFESIPARTPICLWEGKPITLNNGGDSLAVFDSDGDVVDRVDYLPSWGGNQAGKSLERISAMRSSNVAANWATSVDSSGSTPGRINSRSRLSTLPNDILVITPNPFSPDGDGREDELHVQYHLNEADSRLDLKIFDVRGREVSRLANNFAAGLSGEIIWNGNDENGRGLPTGLYIIYLEAFSKGETRLQTAKRAVALARRS